MTKELNELADRLEAATGPDRELDKEMHKLFCEVPELAPKNHSYGWREEKTYWWCDIGEDQRTPRKTITPKRYTSSIDAAMTLVPDGWETAIYLGGVNANVQMETEEMRQKMGFFPIDATAVTPALAICVAALRART